MNKTEKFFIACLKSNELNITKSGIVFNSMTNNWIGAVGSGGYYKISMLDQRSGIIRHIQTHRLVWLWFKSDIPEDMEINHIDGNRLNNRLKNLELLSHIDNTKHAHKLGLVPYFSGSKNGQSKLTEAIVSKLRKRYKRKPFNMAEMAKKYNVSKQVISLALRGKTWKQVEEKPIE